MWFRMARPGTVRAKVLTPAKTLILVNPVAGGGRAERARPHVADYLARQGFRAEFAQPQSAQDLQRLAREGVAAGYGAIVALGGDGTFQQIVQATLGSQVVLGFFPAGGGNDIAAALGIPRDPVAARYIAGALWALATFAPFHVTAEIDGQPAAASGPMMFAAIANTPTYGAGVKIAPTAEIDDGQLDLVLVGELAWTRLLEVIPLMLRTGDVRWPEIQRFRARRVVLRADRAALFHGDGELLGEAPVEVENLPGAIVVAAPPRK